MIGHSPGDRSPRGQPLSGQSPADLPEAAGRRLRAAGFSSALSIADFAACLHMGLRPVGLVQGFCAMSWYPDWYLPGTSRGGFSFSGWGKEISSYACPHSIVHSSEHPYRGYNVEATGVEGVWSTGYNATYIRMMEEAEALGAHGVIGVTDATRPLLGPDVREFHLLGTAVVLDGAPPPERPWSTYLAGSKLGKLFEAGLEPVSVVGALAAVTIVPSCVTELQEHGSFDRYGVVSPIGEIIQLSDAYTAARRLARDHVKSTLGSDSLHGADLEVSEGRVGNRAIISAVLRGTRVRRVRDAEPLPLPVPTVHIS